MKKLIIGLILAVNVFLLTVTTVKADFVTNDYFLNNELYLFSYDIDFTNPNFENGYISKRNITYSDIEQDNNNYFYSWYRRLGIDLIYDYVNSGGTDENFYMAIKLNNITASTFQIAYSVDSPYDANYILMYNDGTYLRISASNNGYTSVLIPPENQSQKIATYFLWDVYNPDYISSFKTLTNQDSYNLGYNAGENSGFNSGYNSGYSQGYLNGYNSGVIDGAEAHDISLTMNFNQLIQNGNFNIRDNWNVYNLNYTTNENTAEITTTNTNGILYQDINVITGHKYLVICHLKSNGEAQTYLAAQTYYNNTSQAVTTISNFVTSNNFQLAYAFVNIAVVNPDFCRVGVRSTEITIFYAKNIMFFDLTQLYGSGNEPTEINDFLEMFPSSYYEYTQSELINLNTELAYNSGKNEGYQIGYNEAQATQVLSDGYGWIRNIFRGMGDFLAIQILPNISIGLIIGIPFIISVAWFVIRAFRGGGGE